MEDTYKVLVDCDAQPHVPEGLTLAEHKKGGILEFDPSQIAFYRPGGPNGGTALREKLEGLPTLNACVLDHWLVNPALIPEFFKKDEAGNQRCISFWGTIYREEAGWFCVRYLYWSFGKWTSGHKMIITAFLDGHVAALLAR